MNIKELSHKIANNILEFMFDPTVLPLERRLYFRPEEILDNSSYEKAKEDAQRAYGDQRLNSDFYPNRPLFREASLMERKNIIASLDILSKSFTESDPIAKDLRTMAYAVSKMSEEEFNHRLDVEAKKKVEMIKCPKCGANVMKQTGYCLKCKKKISEMKTAEESGEKVAGKIKGPGIPDGTGPMKDDPSCPKNKDEKEAVDFWTKEAAEAVRIALIGEVSDVKSCEDKKEETTPAPEKRAKKEETTPAPEKKAKREDTTPAPEKKAKKEDTTPAPEKKEEATPAPEKKEETTPAPEKKAECGKPHKKEEEEEKDAAELVDTTLLAFDGIEMRAGLCTMDDIGDLSDAEKENLSQLFK